VPARSSAQKQFHSFAAWFLRMARHAKKDFLIFSEPFTVKYLYPIPAQVFRIF